MDKLLQDLYYGFRMLVKRPGFTLVAIITLAIGIGANTAIFSVVQAVLLHPLPYKDPERLAIIWTTAEKIGLKQNWVSGPELLDIKEHSRLFEDFGVVVNDSKSVTGSGEPEQVISGAISANFFSVLKVKPLLGRDFNKGEDSPSAENLVMLGNGFWKRKFGADPEVIGKRLFLNGNPYTVIGILPEGFNLLLPADAHVATNIDLWETYKIDYAKIDRNDHWLTVIGRLKQGVTQEQAQSEMDALTEKLNPLYYEGAGFSIKVVSLHADIVKKIRPALLVLLGVVGFVLLIACANVANLLLARSSIREKEIVVRSALGASRFRIIRQLLTESVLLALIGGALGLLLAVWGMDALLSLSPPDLPRFDEIKINEQVLGFTLLVTFLTGIAFGLVPALQISKPDLVLALKEGGRSSLSNTRGRRMRDLIVIAQISLSLVLLIGAGLLVKSFIYLQRIDPGFNPKNVLTMKLQLPESRYQHGVSTINFYKELIERIEKLPGVESASAITHLPLSNEYWSGTYTFQGVTAGAEKGDMASFEADTRIIAGDYFKTMGATLIAGRTFNDQDVASRPMVAIIDDGLARRCWPGENAVGKRLTFGQFPDNPKWVEIIGVVKHLRHHQLAAEGREQVYFTHQQRPRNSLTLAIRSTSDPLSLVPAVQSTVWSLDKDQPVYKIRTMESLISGALAPSRFILLLILIFSSIAAVLAMVGIYSVISYASTQRTQEIGIRMALGAQRSDIFKLMLGQGLPIILIGSIAGLTGAFILTRVMSSFLYGVSAIDPITFFGVSLLLAVVALSACYIPARRATKIDPMVALRYE